MKDAAAAALEAFAALKAKRRALAFAAVRLRDEGASVAAIAEALGCSTSWAAELLERGELQRAERPTVRIERNAAGEAE